ncbi:hypothetical protein T12_16357 [Trichinella patagoniensis]|uniref:Uncharacterized protein n=1 Tax=Trichinella patagoniensis TaxID=990121 RepID=A0A0V0YXR4_9BILA|nr:hypothetical protein T12_16357 [Trichinella patagoniensis]
MQADLEIHFSHDRLSVRLGVWGTHTRCITIKRLSLLKIQQRFYNFLQKSLLPCNAESQKRNFMHRANCCRWVRCVSDDQNVNDKTVRRRL